MKNKRMKWFFSGLLAVAIVNAVSTEVSAKDYVRGMNLTELGVEQYDAALPGGAPTSAQLAVDQMRAIGITHVILNPRAVMTDPRGNDLFPMTPTSQRSDERARYLRLIQYIHSQKMTVGIRPIFFVTKPDGSFPYREVQPDGSIKTWWHGNIQPSDPNRWFGSFKNYLDIYLLIAKLMPVEEFTIGAELYSMTVGIEDQWKEYPYGFPGRWLELLRYTKSKLSASTRIMYDINFTDDVVKLGSISASGGELERWRYRIVDLANPSTAAQQIIWQDIVQFWLELDAIGIDIYRSLADRSEAIPTERARLVNFLRTRTDEFASQLDNTAVSIEATVGKRQKFMFKEAGYRSIERGFIDPFNYETASGDYEPVHQAAAYEALFESFWLPQFDWFFGGSFWDVSVDRNRNRGIGDTGFSPINKPETVEVLKRIYNF